MKRFAIVVSQFNEMITGNLLKGCLKALQQAGVQHKDSDTLWVPGAFELPLAAQKLAQTGRYDAVICLGAVIRGDTPHFDYVCDQAASGIMRVSLDESLPVIFGVLTTDTLEQAQERSGEHVGNKGEDAAMCAIAMAELEDLLEQGA